MASTTSYIGPSWLAPDGADSYVDLTTWETAVQSGAALQTAILVADIVDNLVFSGWTTGGSVLIKGDLTGNIKRKITSAPGGAHIMHPTSGGMSILTLQDLLIDCGPQASYKSGIYCSSGFVKLTMERVTVKDAKSIGLNVATASLYEEGTIDNCIFNGNRYAIGLLEIAAENTTIFRNCLFTGATASSTMLLADDANQIAYFYNCISFDNTGDDFDYAEKASLTYVNNCVSSDSSANDTDHTVPSLGNAITQALLSTYFRSYNTGRFQLLNDDESLWTINGDSANTPDLDYTSRTRTNDDIGPYEFVSRTYGQLLLVDITPDVDGVIEDEAEWEDHAQAVQSPCGTFDGVDDIIEVGDLSADVNTWTTSYIHLRFKHPSDSLTILFSCKHTLTDDLRVQLNDAGTLSVMTDDATRVGGGTVEDITTTLLYDDNEWHEMTFVHDNVAGTLNLTVDTEVVSEVAGNWQYSSADGATTVGGRTGGTFFMQGQLCDVQFGKSSTDLILDFPLSEGSNTTVYDISPRANRRTVTGATSAEFWANKQDEFHWSLAKGFTQSGTVEVPALTNGTLDAQGNTITNPAGAWHNQGITQISGIFDAVANWSYSGALSDPNFYLLDYSENAYAFSHGLGYIELGVSDDIVSIVGTPIGLQSLGNMSYSIGGRGPDTSVSLYADTTEVTGLGSRTKYIIQDNYLRYNATQDIVSTSGTNDGQQNLDNITYSFGRRISVKDLEDKITKENIVDNTGLYQSRFESYLEIVE